VIKRRRDYEAYLKRISWHQEWQIFGNVYSIYVLWHPEFIKHIWNDWRGKRCQALKAYLRKPVYNSGKAQSEEQIKAEHEYCKSVSRQFWEYMIDQLNITDQELQEAVNNMSGDTQ